jgi:putative transposase
MDTDSTTSPSDATLFTGEGWFDPIEAGLRGRVRGFIEDLIEEELASALGRGRYVRGGAQAVVATDAGTGEGTAGHRHGHRSRQLMGSFGAVEIAVPRARMAAAAGATTEWRSRALTRYARRTRQVEALIAGAYLAGVNTRRVRRALAALFAGAVSKDIVSRTWRKVKTDWDVWRQRSLAEENIVRLILHGTVVRVRLDKKATNISLLVVLGVRRDGQKVLLSPETAAMLFWALLASGQITMRKVDGWQTLAETAPPPIDLAA